MNFDKLKIVKKLQFKISETFLDEQLICIICFKRVTTPTITVCGHLFCTICIFSYISKSTSSLCPICRTAINFMSMCRIYPLENLISYIYLSKKSEESCENIIPIKSPAKKSIFSLGIKSNKYIPRTYGITNKIIVDDCLYDAKSMIDSKTL